MPYTSKKDRERYEPALSTLREVVKKEIKEGRMAKGDLTYLVYAISLDSFKGREGYTTISTAISCLEDAAAELRRRHLAPYEDKKIKENGDVE